MARSVLRIRGVSANPEVKLEPVVAARCVVCGGERRQLLCSAAELRVQNEVLRDFHRRRLKRRAGDQSLADRADFTQAYTTDIVGCPECGLIMRACRPPADEVLEAYSEDEYGPERLEALFAAQLQASRVKTRQMRRHLSVRRPAVVEVGSFVGGFLAAAAELGWDAVGLDPGEEVGEFCRGKGLRVYCAPADGAPIAAGSVDCVAIWNTFDQLPDPRPVLTAARRWLRDEGLLVIRVPNGAAFRAAMRRPGRLQRDGLIVAALAWNNLLGFPYLYGYSPATLDRLATASGFTRRALRGDVLMRLADRDTRPWAAREEQAVKTLWLAAARFAPETAPWIDVYYKAVSL